MTQLKISKCVKTLFKHVSKNEPILGRWKLKNGDKLEHISVFWTNSDHCGDSICGDVVRNKEILIKDLKQPKH